MGHGTAWPGLAWLVGIQTKPHFHSSFAACCVCGSARAPPGAWAEGWGSAVTVVAGLWQHGPIQPLGRGQGTPGQSVPSSSRGGCCCRNCVTENFTSFLPCASVSVQPSSLPDPPGQSQSSGGREPQQWGEEQLPGKILTLLWERGALALCAAGE